MPVTNTITVPYTPQGVQKEYYKSNTRYTICRIGRQWGKSMIAMLRGVKRSILQTGIYWWVEPTIPQSKVHMRRMAQQYSKFIKPNGYNKSDRSIELINGSVWYFKGADDPENLEGETLDGLVLDEAAKYPEEVWFQTLKPMLAVKQGWVDFIGKPRGNNYFKRLWNSAETDNDWTRIHYASNTSPFFSQTEYDEARANTPLDIFRQEYDAEFVDYSGTVFRNLEYYPYWGELEPANPGKKYYAGIDLARTHDFTVIVILDHRKKICAFERFNNIPWSLQKEKIKKICSDYNANVVIDSTGLGDPIFDDLAMAGMKISGYKFTNQTKRVLIEQLIMDLENEELTMVRIPELINEMNNFEKEETSSGLIRYHGSQGVHDDGVIALSLANYNCIKKIGSTVESEGNRTFKEVDEERAFA